MARKALSKAFGSTPAATAIAFAVICVMPHIAPPFCRKLVPLRPSPAIDCHQGLEPDADGEDEGDWEPWLATLEGHERQLPWCRGGDDDREAG